MKRPAESVWESLERALQTVLLPEELMYRGESDVRYQDVAALMDTLGEAPPDPEGGAVDTSYEASPRVWSKWSRTLGIATALASTDRRTSQHKGAPYGGTVMKRAYKGQVFYQPGPAGGGFDRAPSGQDRYDVLMSGEVKGAPGGSGLVDLSRTPAGIWVKRIAWSPAVGPHEERLARLQALMRGESPGAPSRRPMPGTPGLGKRDTRGPEVAKDDDGPSFGAPTPSMGFRTGKGHDPNHQEPEWLRKQRAQKKRRED